MMKTSRRPLPISWPSLDRRGFTLVEILLSLGLMMLVLAAAYSGLTVFQRVTVAGRYDAERSQIARAIERRIAADVRCVLFQQQQQQEEPPSDESSTTGLASVNTGTGAAENNGLGTAGAGSSTSRMTSTTNSTTNSGTSSGGSTSTGSTVETGSTATPADAYASQSSGVFGDATTLVLHVAKPSRETATSLETATTLDSQGAVIVPRRSDLRSISYFLAVAGGGGLQGVVGNKASGGSALIAKEQGVQGLARLDGDRLAIQQADENGQTDLLAQQATVVAEEVTELTFRYFDGIAWVDTWDSASLGALPRAIEVTMRIDLKAKNRTKSTFDKTPASSDSDLYRFVVALPLADPTLGMEQL